MTDDDKALVERLQTNQCADNMGCNPLAPYCQCAFMDDAADRIEALSADNERLRDALREVFEQWAGSEGFIPETAPEGYLLHLTKRMADIARAALGETR